MTIHYSLELFFLLPSSGPLLSRYAGPVASSLSGPVVGAGVTRTVVGPTVVDPVAPVGPLAPIAPVASVYGTPGVYV